MAPPNPYYPERPGVSGDLVRESRMSEKLRLRMVRFAKKEGVKPAARAFGPTLGVGPKSGANAPGTTPKTVRKWVGRFDGTLSSLQELSRRPHRSPNKLSAEAEAEILAARKKAPCGVRPAVQREGDQPCARGAWVTPTSPEEEARDEASSPRGQEEMALPAADRRGHEERLGHPRILGAARGAPSSEVPVYRVASGSFAKATRRGRTGRDDRALLRGLRARDIDAALGDLRRARDRASGVVWLRSVEDDLAVGQRLRVRRQLAVVRSERVHPADRKRPGPEAQGDPAGGAPVPVGPGTAWPRRGDVSQPRGDGTLRG